MRGRYGREAGITADMAPLCGTQEGVIQADWTTSLTSGSIL
jgi:hypothetical protein